MAEIGVTVASRAELWMEDREEVTVHTPLRDAQGRPVYVEIECADGRVTANVLSNDPPILDEEHKVLLTHVLELAGCSWRS